MHARLPVLALACCVLGLSACSDGDGSIDGRDTFTTHILSDARFDGDIERDTSGAFFVTQGMSTTVQNVLVGIDPASGSELRAFLDFPLGGSNGVPADALIDSAFLEIYIDDLQPITGRLPVRVDLVAFQPPNIVDTDFSRTVQPALASVIVTPDITRSDVGTFVPIDVTALMKEAQRRRLVDFQVRILEDLGPAIPVLMAVNDTTSSNRSNRAPLLTVTYF
jgi:hypothetical protein